MEPGSTSENLCGDAMPLTRLIILQTLDSHASSKTMADTSATAKTPRAAEPRADYAIQVEPATTPTSTTMASRSYVARVYREYPDGEKFDEHGIRIGRWEMEPCGDDCAPNAFMALCLPCVSAVQISHRLGGSYTTMLFLTVVSVAVETLAVAMVNSTLVYESYYDTYTGMTRTFRREDEPYVYLWMILAIAASLVYVMTGVYLRDGVRTRYQIPAVCCGDCCCMLWCSCCALTAMATHIKSYKPGHCDIGPGADQLPGYDVEPTKE